MMHTWRRKLFTIVGFQFDLELFEVRFGGHALTGNHVGRGGLGSMTHG